MRGKKAKLLREKLDHYVDKNSDRKYYWTENVKTGQPGPIIQGNDKRAKYKQLKRMLKKGID